MPYMKDPEPPRERASAPERRLQALMERHADGHPISDDEHHDARLAIIAVLLMVAEGQRRQRLDQEELAARLPDPQLQKEQREFFESRRAFTQVGRALKTWLLWIAALGTGIVAIKTMGVDLIKALFASGAGR